MMRVPEQPILLRNRLVPCVCAVVAWTYIYSAFNSLFCSKDESHQRLSGKMQQVLHVLKFAFMPGVQAHMRICTRTHACITNRTNLLGLRAGSSSSSFSSSKEALLELPRPDRTCRLQNAEVWEDRKLKIKARFSLGYAGSCSHSWGPIQRPCLAHPTLWVCSFPHVSASWNFHATTFGVWLNSIFNGYTGNTRTVDESANSRVSVIWWESIDTDLAPAVPAKRRRSQPPSLSLA